jgi:hypothetical protein
MHPQSHTTFKIQFNIILHSMLDHANGLISSWVPIKMLFVFPTFMLHAPSVLFFRDLNITKIIEEVCNV